MKYFLSTLLIAVLCGSVRAQYCTTGLYTNGCSDSDYIHSVVTVGGTTNINNVTPGCATGTDGYAYYSTQTLTAPQGVYVGFTITNNDDYEETYFIFIDWNEDADFDDAGEQVFNRELIESEAYSGAFYIPSTATAGTKRMRVRCVYFPDSVVTACTLENYGEVEDYNLVVVASPGCSGTPAAGLVTASDTSVCSGQTVALSGFSFPIGVSGLTFQWEQRAAGSGAFTAIAGETAPSTTVTHTAAQDYRLAVTCGTAVGYLDTVSVGVLPPRECYCSPLTGSPVASLAPLNLTTSVSIPTTTLAAATSVEGPDGYLLQTTPPVSNTATLSQSATYTLALGVDGSASSMGNVFTGAWIDYDTSGSFDVDEYIALTPNASNDSASGLFTVPATAAVGTTRLRVISGLFSDVLASASCDDVGVGEWEDYFVTINSCSPPSSLTIAPAPGTAALSWTAVASASGYEYAATASATPPTVGTATTATSVTVTGLPSATAYYAHVRSVCGSTASSWKTQAFTTGTVGIGRVKGRDGFSITAAPNPVQDVLRVEVQRAAKDASLRLLDAAGHAVRDVMVVNGTADISTAGLPAGVYLLRYTDAAFTEVLRIQKQ